MWTNAFFTYLNNIFPQEKWMYRLPPALFNLSLTASIVILAVLVARLLLRKAPRVYSYALWAVVAFRLICPISFSSTFSLLGIIDAPVAETGQAEYVPVNIVHTPFPSVDLMVPEINETINKQLPQGAAQLGADPLEAPAALATSIWIIGVSVLLIWALSSYLSLHKKMRTAVLLEKNVFQSDQVGSPFILGFFRPKIYIPFGLDDSTLRYVLAHEQYHIKRFDHIVKIFSFAILAVHWFNPLCWLAFHLMSKDMEMNCDEKVLSTDHNSKTEYSTILLSFAANHRFPSPCPLAFGETSAKSRIKNALKWKRPKVWVTILAVVLCIAVIAACAANPISNVNSDSLDGLSLSVVSVKQGTDTTSITVNLSNQSEKTVYFGSMWWIESLSDTEWQDEPHAYTTEMRIFKPGETEETTLRRELPPGTYRISKAIIVNPKVMAPPNLTDSPIVPEMEYDLSAIFTIAEAGENLSVTSSAEKANTALLEFIPTLSSSYPAFPFRFNFPYTHIRATCINGTLAVYESDGENYGHRQSLQYTAGQTIYWEPYYNGNTYYKSASNELISSATVISFTIYDNEDILYTGNVQIEQVSSDSASGSYFYAASLIDCDGLALTQADDNIGGGWISEFNRVHPITGE